MLIHAYNWFKFLFLILGLVNRLKLTTLLFALQMNRHLRCCVVRKCRPYNNKVFLLVWIVQDYLKKYKKKRIPENKVIL